MTMLQTKSSLSIYHIPSVFFKELVERDRGFRMILMAGLFLPHPRTLHLQTCPHKVSRTLTNPLLSHLDPLNSPLMWSDHSPHWFKLIQWKPPSLNDSLVKWLGLPNLSPVQLNTQSKVTAHSPFLSSVPLTVGVCLA